MPHKSGVLIPTLLFALSCGPEELNGGPNFVCEEIGRTIANVTWSCGATLEAANRRGRDFISDYQCTGPTTAIGEYMLEIGLQCPVAMAQMPCDVAEQAGDDLDRWVAAVPTCRDIVMKEGSVQQ